MASPSSVAGAPGTEQPAAGPVMGASCATPELAKQAMPKLRRLWKARNSLSSKLSERRAMLRREGIIAHCNGASCDEEEGDGDDDDDSTELSASPDSV
jgi:hypothetical protein